MSQQKNKKVQMVQYKRSPNFVALYVNHINIGFTNVDFQIICARSEATMVPDSNTIDEIANITLSPAHGKLFLKALEENIRIYEAQHGEIALPKLDPPKEINT